MKRTIALCNCKTCVKLRTPKSLARYLATISDMGMLKNQAFFERALKAYESTEGVVIQIIVKKK